MKNFGHSKTKVWQDTTITSTREAHREGLSTGLKAPSGKGKRLIIVHIGILYSMTTLVVLCGGESWRWPDVTDSPSIRIDTKIKFVDERENTGRRENVRHKQDGGQLMLDEAPFVQATETLGFYNRPPNSGRFPVRVETPHPEYNTHRGKNYPYESNLEGLQYCKCVTTPNCQLRVNSAGACSSGKFLCCYKRQNTGEFFNEIEDERPMLFPGHESLARPFPPPPTLLNNEPAVLVGPPGPTGIIGPTRDDRVVRPDNKGILVGPNRSPQQEPNESAQRGVLVGPGGPTGIIGPAGYDRRQVLVGPGGPTGVIGPRGPRPGYYGQGYGRQGFGRQTDPGVLVGPGGPTGIIGPGRQILTGPGGPTGVIGPRQNYYGK